MKTIKDHFKKIEQNKNPNKRDVFAEALKRKINEIDEPPKKYIKTVETNSENQHETETIALLKKKIEELESEKKLFNETEERLNNKVADFQKQNEALQYKYSNLKIKYVNILQNVYATHVKMMKGETLQSKTKEIGVPPLTELIDHVENNIQIPVDDMERLTNVPILPHHDATFIREAIKTLYKDNMDNLNHRTLTGQHSNGKTQMTPSKRMKIISLFEGRLENKSISPSDRIDRFKNMNKLISNGINYIQLKDLGKLLRLYHLHSKVLHSFE